MATTSSESLRGTVCAVAVAATAAWVVSTRRKRFMPRRRPSRDTPTSTPATHTGLDVDSDWEEFDRETAELDALRRLHRTAWDRSAPSSGRLPV